MNRGERLARLADAIAADRGRTFDIRTCERAERTVRRDPGTGRSRCYFFLFVLAIVWLVLMAGVFYLLLWRPQQRRMRQCGNCRAHLELGDEVMTTSGIFGRIVELATTTCELEIAPGTVVRVARGAIGERLTADPEPDAEVSPTEELAET